MDTAGAPRTIEAPCGNRAWFDPESTTYGYRCEVCFAVVGSVGMPTECQSALPKDPTK